MSTRFLLATALVFCAQLAKASEPTVAELKTQIYNLAKSYEGQADPDGSKKASLEVLINELTQIAPQHSLAEKAATAVGAWRQVWGPYFYNKSFKFNPPLDPKNIYQVISPRGFYTNVGVYDILGLKIVGVLEGRFSVEQTQIAIEFTKNSMLTEAVPQGFGLADVPALVEANRVSIITFPKEFKPVGIRGSLREIFSDDQLRITYGTQEGESGESLYVLERVKALAY